MNANENNNGAATQALSLDGGSTVDARLVIDGDAVRLHRNGAAEPGLIENDLRLFEFLSSRPAERQIVPPSVILHVTSRCNLTCPLCYEGDVTQPSVEPDIATLRAVADRYPRHTVMVIGGMEPTVRSDLPKIVEELSRTHPTRILTNGIRMADPGYTRQLKDAGLGGVNYSLNGLDEESHIALNGRAVLKKKLAGLDACEAVGLPCVLSMVLARGINEDQLLPMIRFGLSRPDVVDSLFVRTAIPVGRATGGAPFTLSEMIKRLADAVGENVEPFVDEMRLMAGVFDTTGNERCRPKTCAAEVHVRLDGDRLSAAGRGIPDWARDRQFRSKAAVSLAVAQTYGIRYPLGQLSRVFKVPFRRHPGRFFRVSLRSWPTPDKLDLRENRKCTTGYFVEGEVRGFCCTNAAREAARSQGCPS